MMPALVTIGRILFAVMFVYLGAAKLVGLQLTTESIAAKVNIPALFAPYAAQLETLTKISTSEMLAIAVGTIEVVSGLMILINFGVRFFAIILIFVVAAGTFYYYDFWNQPLPGDGKMLADALRNLSIIGALLVLAGHGTRARLTTDTQYSDV